MFYVAGVGNTLNYYRGAAIYFKGNAALVSSLRRNVDSIDEA